MLIVFTVFVPENSGLQRFNYLVRKYLPLASLQPARGERIPELVEQCGGYGWTGNDLYSDYLLGNKTSRLRAVYSIPWPEPTKPKLCLLGPAEENFPSPQELCAYDNGVRAAVPDKYVNITMDYFTRKSWNPVLLIRKGQVERQIRAGGADIAIDIVYSGRTLREENLCVRDIVFDDSGLVLLGKEPAKDI